MVLGPDILNTSFPRTKTVKPLAAPSVGNPAQAPPQLSVTVHSSLVTDWPAPTENGGGNTQPAATRVGSSMVTLVNAAGPAVTFTLYVTMCELPSLGRSTGLSLGLPSRSSGEW